MTIRQIVNILELEKIAPIHYHNGTIEDVFMTILYVKDKLPDLTQDETCGIYLPDTDTVGSCCWINNVNKSTFEVIAQKNSLQFNEQNASIIFSVFCILHEVGHWIDYNKKNSEQKLNWILATADRLEKLDENRRINRAIFPQMPIDFHDLSDHIEYRDLPHEKIADTYAREHYLSAYTKINQNRP